jgi:Lysylphosphatidylglycerol synthase TM region
MRVTRGMIASYPTLATNRMLVRAAGALFSILAIVACALLARRLTSAAWPLQRARFDLVATAGCAYFVSFLFRALGWHRLFPVGERPDRSRCLAACGAAAASGAVLPFRLDYVVKISTLRRLGGVRVDLEAIALSIVALGLVDAVAMLPLVTAALVTSGSVFRAPLIVVLLFCLGCVGVLLAGRRLVRLPLVSRSRRLTAICGRVGERTFSRSTFAAGGFLLGCWLTRALGNMFLLAALGVGFSPTFALVILCMSAAASILPITAGGAIVSVGATSVVLVALGVSTDQAVKFSLAAGLLITSSALVAATAGVIGSVVLTFRRRHADLALE